MKKHNDFYLEPIDLCIFAPMTCSGLASENWQVVKQNHKNRTNDYSGIKCPYSTNHGDETNCPRLQAFTIAKQQYHQDCVGLYDKKCIFTKTDCTKAQTTQYVHYFGTCAIYNTYEMLANKLVCPYNRKPCLAYVSQLIYTVPLADLNTFAKILQCTPLTSTTCLMNNNKCHEYLEFCRHNNKTR